MNTRSEYTFGMNGIFLIRDWLGFEPTYYSVEDNLFHEDRLQDIKHLVGASACAQVATLGCGRTCRSTGPAAPPETSRSDPKMPNSGGLELRPSCVPFAVNGSA
jgi:hypothetical protein